jgi:hypothetical protein
MNMVHQDIRDDKTERGTVLFLMSWWSEHYNRPLKDPVLQEYTLEELSYEYYNYHKRQEYKLEKQEENDRIEEDKAWDEAEAWADEMEAMDEAERQTAETVDPREDPKNIEWMQKQIDDAKKQFGDDVGEDLSISFEDD